MDEMTNVNTTETTSTTEEAPKVESTVETETSPYYKYFETEADFKKFEKSASQKRVSELYKELGVESKEQLKEMIGYKAQYEEIFGKYNAMSEEYAKYKSDNEAALQERENLSRQLTLSKLGITDNEEMREDFIMAVDALSVKKDMTFEKAAEDYLSRHPEFKDVSFRNGLKIGSEKSSISEDLEDGVTKAFKKNNPWYKG